VLLDDYHPGLLDLLTGSLTQRGKFFLATYTRIPIYRFPMDDNTLNFLPLNPATLHILLALAGEDMHGYGIMQEVERQSIGHYKLGPGTLYDNLQKLLDQGLIAESARAGEPESRRRYYRLTALGRKVLSADLQRLETLVREARAKVRIPKPRRA
jgi:DNA-binding PadR family transcriptional regulator